MAVWHPSVRIEFRSVYSLVFGVWEVSPFIADGCGVKGRLDSIQRFLKRIGQCQLLSPANRNPEQVMTLNDNDAD